MKKKLLLTGLLALTLLSCGGPKKTVLLEGGNAYDLLQQYISKTHTKPGDLRVEVWDGKNIKAYTLSWQQTLTGADYMTLWKQKLEHVNALYKPGLDKEAKANHWDVYISPLYSLENTAYNTLSKVQNAINNAVNSNSNNNSSNTTANNGSNNSACNNQAGSDINLGLQLVTQGDFKGASKQFKQAVKDDSKCSLAYLNLASAYLERKDYDKAIDVAKEGLKNAGENKDLEYVLAEAYSDDNKLDYAEDALKKALKDGFNDPNKLAHDPDLENLRKQRKSDFCDILNKYKIAIKYCLV
ncbi:tetratricopeptide repeat protein [Hydrogenobaculum acidophilum]